MNSLVDKIKQSVLDNKDNLDADTLDTMFKEHLDSHQNDTWKEHKDTLDDRVKAIKDV